MALKGIFSASRLLFCDKTKLVTGSQLVLLIKAQQLCCKLQRMLADHHDKGQASSMHGLRTDCTLARNGSRPTILFPTHHASSQLQISSSHRFGVRCLTVHLQSLLNPNYETLPHP